MSDQPEQTDLVPGLEFQFIQSNGIRMCVGTAGESGPLLLLAHGWPETWYSWRHQIAYLVQQGYRVAVPQMRGYGQTDAPEEVASYDIKNLSADLVGVLDALGEETAVMVGHDWGAIVAWNTVLTYSDRFPALIAMSVPYAGRTEMSLFKSYQKHFGENF